MFGHNDAIAADTSLLRGIYRETAHRLIERGEEITRLRDELGYTEPFGLFDRYTEYRKMRSANALGEPKLAVQFVKELGFSQRSPALSR